MGSNILILGVIFVFFHYTIAASNLVETRYFRQRVDHFRYGTPLYQVTFDQRYYIDRSFWSGPKESGPILVYFGGESELLYESFSSSGVITNSAPHLGALVVYIEHRFYGVSIPYGSIDLAMNDHEVRGCLTTSQALMDFYEIIFEVKQNLSAQSSPVIVIGGSYAGVLAALFRSRFPGMATGALASSAPMYFDMGHAKDFYSVVSRDFEEINRDCYENIRQSWEVIDEIGNQLSGLLNLSDTFRSCNPLITAKGLKSFLVDFFTFTAQYNGRYSYWINKVCDNILDPANRNTIEGIAQALAAAYPEQNCFDIGSLAENSLFVIDRDSEKAWRWQLCSELAVPFNSEQDTMIPAQSFNISDYVADCERIYGVELSPWVACGERNDLIMNLQENIIFSNGLRDPYSSLGVVGDISETIVAINTNEGSHCLDLGRAKPDDPKWLVHQRQEEMRIFKEWVEKAHRPHSSGPSWKPQYWLLQLFLLWLLL